jgi:hypothetical protein
MRSNESLPCNCCHSKEDHHFFTGDDGIADKFYAWCRYSEDGQCPCDRYTSMTNLEYLEYLNEQRQEV